jgi:diguanylate cyclase
MLVSNDNKPLRLVKPSANSKKKIMGEKKQQSASSAEVYYKQVEQFAQQIRKSSDVSEIIGMLETVLNKTRDIPHGSDIYSAQEQVRLAEKKIELLKLELEQLRELVHTDPMTGTFNRRGLNAIYLREAARADRNESTLCAVLIDLDNFKFINDTHGHQFGDAVLIHFARIARESLRPSDVIARYGGEEFIILLPDITTESAACVMQRLQHNFSLKTLTGVDGEAVSVTFSGGMALRRFRENQNSLIKRADEALYLAKNSGKNRVMLAPNED